MPENILVTGAAGFIGSALVKRLLRTNNNVIAVVRPDSDLWRIEKLKGNIKIEQINLLKPRSVKMLFSKHSPTSVIHLATHGVYPFQKDNTKRIILGNYEMTFNLLNDAKKFGVKKFVNSGSVFEYGTKYGKVKENEIDITDVLNDYSASKFATTALAASFYDSIPILTLRYFTAYGPFEDATRFVRTTINRALKNEDLILVPGVVRDFVFVEDIADGVYKAVRSKFRSEVINIGSGHKSTLESVAKTILQQTKSKSKIIFNDSYKRKKDSACWADISKANKLLGWKPKHTIANGVKKTVEWVRSNG